MARDKSGSCLKVFSSGIQVGNLVRTSLGVLEFQYDLSWINSPGAFPISNSLPLTEGVYRDLKVQTFFDNLLPDSDALRIRLAEKSQAKGKTPFDLLEATGRDCVGALQFLPEGEDSLTHKISGELIKETEIAKVLKNLRLAPLGMDRDHEFRISIAGVQKKTALLNWNGKWYRPLGSTPTTYILKPQIGMLPNGVDLRNSVENEWFCLKLCEYFGLPVATAEISDFKDVRCLVVKRFDREWSSNQKALRRIPQEDLCQALGTPWSRKYEQDGGPGIAPIMGLLNSSNSRSSDRSQFMRSLLVFFLLGATDGHAKNFSIAINPTGFNLTPLYDVMSASPALASRQIESKQFKLAMAVGDRRCYRLRDIVRRHWEQTAKKTGFPLSQLNPI